VFEKRSDQSRAFEEASRTLRSALGGLFLLAIGTCIVPIRTYALPADELEVGLSRAVRITGDASGNYEFFRVATAAEDARHVMVCTLHTSAVTNEVAAEVFVSADGGETWNLRLRDGSSHNVSEDACAFGEAGKAYFIAQPWNIKNPYVPHASIEQSEMHLYRSSTYGDEWPALLTSVFVDYARIAVDSRPNSPFRGRAYIVGNRTATKEFPLIAVLDGGKRLIEAKQGEQLNKLPGRHGQYPRSLIVLANGDVLASYDLAHAGMNSAVITATRDGGNTVDGPVTIEENTCRKGSSSIAEDSRSETVFAFYSRKSGSMCLPTIASSDDEGRTWKRLPVSLESFVKSTSNGIVGPVSIAFRRDGIALLMWTADKSVKGALFDPVWRPLWIGGISPKAPISGINLAPYVRVDDRLSGNADADMDISLQFGFANSSEADVASLPDGGFVVVWREDDGQLYSRSIRLARPSVAKAPTIIPTKDVTSLVRYEASNITFEEQPDAFEYDLCLINASNVPLSGPFVLRVKNITSTIGSVTLRNAPADEIVFVPQRSTMLLPGENTFPVRIRIQVSSQSFEKIVSSSNHFPRIGIIGRVYAEPARNRNETY
jgi:hypothetical protein